MFLRPNIVREIKSRRLRWESHVVRIEEGRRAFKILTGTPAGNRPLGRPRRRWEKLPPLENFNEATITCEEK